MKRIFVVIILIVSLLCLCSCGSLREEREYRIDIWTDVETGVQYIICYGNGYQSMGGITPRLNADGTPMIYTEDGK